MDESILDILRRASLYGRADASGGMSDDVRSLYLSGLLGAQAPAGGGLLSADVGAGYGMGRAVGDDYDVRWNGGGINNLGLGFSHPKYGNFRMETDPRFDGAMLRYTHKF